MTIRQKFNYEWPEGVTPVSFEDWFKTLTKEEQDEYTAAWENGAQLRQTAIDDGRLTIENGDYVWVDTAAFDTGIENNPVWEAYWRRWQAETGVVFSLTITEE